MLRCAALCCAVSQGALISEGKNQYLEKLYWQQESMSDSLFIAHAREIVADPKKRPKEIPKSFLEFRLDELGAALPINR